MNEALTLRPARYRTAVTKENDKMKKKGVGGRIILMK